MALKKSALYSSLWKSCDELRGGMDASQYKDYVLTLLFVKYVSDKYAGQRMPLIEVPEGGSFADMVRLKGDKEIGDKINKIIARLAEANNLRGVIDLADFNNEDKLGRGKEMVDRLSNLVGIFQDLDLRANRADGDDLLGDAYEYLMRHFATESGKSKGQFYTPAEVSRVIARLLGIGPHTRKDETVYDPTCGSGSLLLKVADEAPRGLSIYGQEMDNATAALARMNMILHGQPTAEIWRDNSLTNPKWTNPDGSLKTFDYVVANPPFSQKNWTSGLDRAHDEFGRFELGIPPAKNGDYAFLLHILKSLKSSGRGAVILPHGVLFRGNAEAAIRRELVRRGLIKAIIGLPPNLFYGTGIPACIVVLDKSEAYRRDGIFMVDASKGFIKDGNKNRLRSQDIHKIVDVFTRQLELPGYARRVGRDEIEANDYNLNIPRYVDSSEPEDLHDLDAHLNGGIPEADVEALARYWEALPGMRQALFTPGPRAGTLSPCLPAHSVKAAIQAHPAYADFAARTSALFAAHRAQHRPTLRALAEGAKPKALIGPLSEALLACFAQGELVDKYDVYQHLMDYWEEAMKDDIYAISEAGWTGAARLRLLEADKESKEGGKAKETPDLVVDKKKYKADLLPPALLIARYFAAEQERVDALRAALEAAEQTLEAFVEEHGGDEGLLDAAKNEKGKVTAAAVKERLKELGGLFGPSIGADTDEEWQALTTYTELMEAKAAADKALKEAQKALDRQVLARYGSLAEEEVKALVVDDKWLARLEGAVQEELERMTQGLAGRVQTLEERYAEPLPALAARTAAALGRVEGHLQRMGLRWKGEL